MKNQASQEPVKSQEQRLQHLLQRSVSKTQLAFRPGGTGIHRPCWHLQFFITLWVCFLTSRSRVLLWHYTEVRGSTVWPLQWRRESKEWCLAWLVTNTETSLLNSQCQKTYLFAYEILWFLGSVAQNLHPFPPSLWNRQYPSEHTLGA